MAPTIVKSIRVTPTLEARIKAVLLDSKEDQSSHRRPMKEAEAMGLALDVGIQELERRTIGWKWRCESCWQRIESVRDGRLEWVELPKTNRGLHLAHAGPGSTFPAQRCGYDQRAELAEDGGIVAGHSLTEMVAPNGFLLMSELAKRTWTDERPISHMWNRLCVPGYEQVHGPRQMEALRAGVYRQRSMSSLWALHLTDIEAIARWMAADPDTDGSKHLDGVAALRILGKSPDLATDGDDE